MPLATWAEEFLSLARRFSPSTQETYERDLRKYILPRFGAYRLGRLPADRYGHLFPELDEAIATSFGERLRDARGRREDHLHAGDGRG